MNQLDLKDCITSNENLTPLQITVKELVCYDFVLKKWDTPTSFSIPSIIEKLDIFSEDGMLSELNIITILNKSRKRELEREIDEDLKKLSKRKTKHKTRGKK